MNDTKVTTRDKKSSRKKRYFVILTISFLAVLIIFGFGYRVSRKSYFCPTCHYMEPYYNKWKSSSHNKIECMKCHDLTVGDQIAFTLKYATGTYSPRTHSIIKNESCLQDGCHSIESLKQDTLFKNFARFNHKKHLQTVVRGVQLKCASCHYQMVQGNHIATNPSTCILCHFYRMPQTGPLVGCPSCHQAPSQEVSVGGLKFDHQPYVKSQVPCVQCHTKIVQGAGSVSIEKCSICHMEHNAEYRDSTKIHDLHVTYLNNNCFTCHDVMQHGKLGMSKVIQLECKRCHQSQHTYAERLYMGIGAKSVEDTPSTMFLSQVSCEGCHAQAESISSAPQAIEHFKSACLVCHEKKYASLVPSWITTSAQLYQSLNAIPDKKTEIIQAKDLIKQGKIIHNPFYAYKIIALMMRETGASSATLTASINSSCASFCHPGLDVKPVTMIAGESFPHDLHGQKVGCITCHSLTKHKVTYPQANECMKCHHSRKVSECARCHGAQKAMFEGTLIQGIKKTENSMSSLECEQCHNVEIDVKATPAAKIADTKKHCLNCHEKGYDDMVDSWIEQWDSSISSLGFAIWQKEKIVTDPQAIQKLNEIKKKYELLFKANGAHNINYADEAVQALNEELKKLE